MTLLEYIIMYVGFCLWFVAGFCVGKSKERRRWIKEFGKAINIGYPRVLNVKKENGNVTFTIGK